LTELLVDLYHKEDVTPFSSDLGKLSGIPIATVAVAYDCFNTYSTYVLIFQQVLFIKSLRHHQLCPNQLRVNDVVVNECPQQFIPIDQRTSTDHSIVLQELTIPLHINGVTSYFNVRKPSQVEITDDITYKHIFVTNDLFWDPSDNIYSKNKASLSYGMSNRIPDATMRYVSNIMITETHPYDFCHKILSRFLISTTGTHRKGTISAGELAKRWYIGTETAQRTLVRTSQLGVQDFLNIKGTRQMKHTAQQLIFRHLRTDIYKDTMFSKVKSLRQNTCAQVYVTSFQWTTVYPLRKKSEAHLSLDKLHRDIGVFKAIIPDNAMELSDGEFRKKAVKAGLIICPTEAYTHNQNLAESGIRE
jgi:hypothetical protein